jgi:uncharacterized membrane protein
VAAFFVLAGIAHFVWPDVYMTMMPPFLPWPHALVLISGACEIAGGVGVLCGITRRSAGIGLLLLLLAVFPANLQMLHNALRDHAGPLAMAALVLRLPLQPLMLWWVWNAAVRE